MAYLGQSLEGYQEQDEFTPIPPGEYEVQIVDSDVTLAKSSGNKMAVFTFSVIGPTHQNRKLFDRFVIGNDVAMSRLKTMAKVAGHKNPNFIKDTEELHGGKLRVRVKIEEARDGYDAKNVIQSFKPLNGLTSPVQESPAPPQSQPQAEKPKTQQKFPWDK
jgi:hypothetical protein